MIDFFHSYGLPVVLHSCGFIEELVPRFIELGFDALNPMENKAGCDPLRLAKTYADKLTFIGGLDVSILESGDRKFIRDKVTTLVKGMKDAGASYIFASDHSISTSVTYEDYKYALEIFRENSSY
jgi:uroporphyrinogen decarboxylase